MMLEEFTLGVFTLCNSLRLIAYVPQIVKAATDRNGAQAVSYGTWCLFLVSHASAVAYALVNKDDWTMASVFLGNAVGCSAVVLTAVCKRSLHQRRKMAQAE